MTIHCEMIEAQLGHIIKHSGMVGSHIGSSVHRSNKWMLWSCHFLTECQMLHDWTTFTLDTMVKVVKSHCITQTQYLING